MDCPDPPNCSGDMYAGVPSGVPVVVKRSLPAYDRARPKSMMIGSRPCFCMMFAGLRSRCMTPRLAVLRILERIITAGTGPGVIERTDNLLCKVIGIEGSSVLLGFGTILVAATGLPPPIGHLRPWSRPAPADLPLGRIPPGR